MSRSAIEKKLTQAAAELRAASDEVRILDEQIQHFANDVDDAARDAAVSGTSGAARDHRHAVRTVEALQKDREVWQDRVRQLERKQDGLLDQLMAQ